MKNILVITALVVSGFFALSVMKQKETAMLYLITKSKELGSSKIRSDVSNEMVVIPKSIQIDRRQLMLDRLNALRASDSTLKYREKSLHMNSGDYLCVATAHLNHPNSDVGSYQRFYFVTSSNKDDIKAKAEKEVMLFITKSHLSHITYDISQPFNTEEMEDWGNSWYGQLRLWINEMTSEEDKKKLEEYKNKKKAPRATGGVRG